jgi:dTDP-glucose pyrophosphorylase
MKVVILAAGKGTRMMPLTEDIPKVLVEVNGKPFLWYVLNHLRLAGFHDFILIGGYKIEKLREFVVNNGINAIVVEQNEQKGTAHALMQVRKFLGNEQFIVLYGDSLFSARDFSLLQERHFGSCIVGKEVEDPSRYGVLFTQGNKLVKIVEKPAAFVGNLVNVGIYKFTPEIWTALNKIEVSPRGELELTDAVTRLALHGNVQVLTLQDYWLDFGTKEDVKRAGDFLKNLRE